MKRLFSRALLILMIVSGVILGSIVQLDVVQASTTVSGVLNFDTTWTQANSPYVVTTPLLVNTGVTLTIEPGVTVHLNGTYMRVAGTLIARGTPTSPIEIICNETTSDHPAENEAAAIQFTSESTGWNEQTGSGSIIENAFITQNRTSNALYIASASPKIRNCTIENIRGRTAVYISSGSPIIVNCSISSKLYGIFCYSSGTSGNPAQILSNVITDCYCGVAILDGTPVIERNIIANNTGNKDNGWGGIRIERFMTLTAPVIRNNTIVGNSVGINLYGKTTPTILFNNIHDNIEYNVYLTTTTNPSIMATHNWWGTTDAQAINQTMFDFKNDFNLGIVYFEPFLTEPNQEVTPDETIPEHTSLIILQFLLTATLLITLCKQRLLKATNKTAHSY